MEIFNTFSLFSGLKPNLTKGDLAVIGALKGVQVVVCAMSCIHLFNETFKILGTYFSYSSRTNKNLTCSKSVPM